MTAPRGDPPSRGLSALMGLGLARRRREPRPRNLSPIYELPYTDVLVDALPGAAPLPLPAGAGSAYVERETEQPGRIALLVLPADAELPPGPDGEPAPRHTLVIEHGGWSLACPLSTGQLHRLTNALDGRGTRNSIRPLAANGEHVHLTGAPERLIVEQGEQRIEIPAGPRRALAKALRAAEPARS